MSYFISQQVLLNVSKLMQFWKICSTVCDAWVTCTKVRISSFTRVWFWSQLYSALRWFGQFCLASGGNHVVVIVVSCRPSYFLLLIIGNLYIWLLHFNAFYGQKLSFITPWYSTVEGLCYGFTLDKASFRSHIWKASSIDLASMRYTTGYETELELDGCELWQ